MTRSTTGRLSEAQRRYLVRLQINGELYIPRGRAGRATGEALVRRGLAEWGVDEPDVLFPIITQGSE